MVCDQTQVIKYSGASINSMAVVEDSKEIIVFWLYLVFGVQEFAPFLSIDACRNTRLRTDV